MLERIQKSAPLTTETKLQPFVSPYPRGTQTATVSSKNLPNGFRLSSTENSRTLRKSLSKKAPPFMWRENGGRESGPISKGRSAHKQKCVSMSSNYSGRGSSRHRLRNRSTSRDRHRRLNIRGRSKLHPSLLHILSTSRRQRKTTSLPQTGTLIQISGFNI